MKVIVIWKDAVLEPAEPQTDSYEEEDTSCSCVRLRRTPQSGPPVALGPSINSRVVVLVVIR